MPSGSPMIIKKIIANIILFTLSVAVGLILTEGLLRIKNADQKNYNIEMWRYARLLKKKSPDPALGHEHIPGRSAKLQGVVIRINSLGMRGPDVDLNDHSKKRILFLGSSNTLGWGVPEEKTLPAIIQRESNDKAVVFNGGIGNYNAARYVTLFEKRFLGLKCDTVVINCFVRDAELLEPGGGNFFLRHSELAVLLFHLYHLRMNSSAGGIGNLVEHYRKIYRHDSPGFQEMQAAFDRLQNLSRQQGFRIILTMIPDVHQINPYPFTFAHEEMQKIASKHGWTFLDFTPALSRVPATDLWAMPGDPHLNSKGHEIMAKTLLPYLNT